MTDSGVSQALRRCHPMLLEKSATLLPIAGIEGNGADELLASHGQPFTNHVLLQQLVRLSCNFCRKART